jgi:hypothetical protein
MNPYYFNVALVGQAFEIIENFPHFLFLPGGKPKINAEGETVYPFKWAPISM